MACVFTATAESDIEAIGDYIAMDNPSRAISFVQDIRTRCEKIVGAPESFSLVPEYGDDIRKVPFGNYLIFYTVDGRDIVILHVMHGARNISSSDFDLPEDSG